MTNIKSFTKEDYDILANAILAFEVFEDILIKSHSMNYFTTCSQQLDFKDSIKKIRLYLINIQEKIKKRR